MTNQMTSITIGDFIILVRGTTTVEGQCMGLRVDGDSQIEEIWIDGFYTGFEITEDRWKIGVESDD